MSIRPQLAILVACVVSGISPSGAGAQRTSLGLAVGTALTGGNAWGGDETNIQRLGPTPWVTGSLRVGLRESRPGRTGIAMEFDAGYWNASRSGGEADVRQEHQSSDVTLGGHFVLHGLPWNDPMELVGSVGLSAHILNGSVSTRRSQIPGGDRVEEDAGTKLAIAIQVGLERPISQRKRRCGHCRGASFSSRGCPAP